MSSRNDPYPPGFLDSLPFAPDPFQTVALQAFAAGSSVVVTAPTGAGKTLVAEGAVEMCLQEGRRVFYTTPIKALSNQKFRDLSRVYGGAKVGLLTGDNSINGEAPVVVMTTEVLRNMIYAGSDLRQVEAVILDEVHYLQDRERGAVWEEVIIHAPPHIRLICLSATVANAAEFTDWVRSRRGPTELVVEDRRPVPLDRWWAVRDRFEKLTHILPLFVKRDRQQIPNPQIHRIRSRRGRGRRYVTPRRSQVVEQLVQMEILPAIYFVFSRAGCEDSAIRLASGGLRLTSDEEREEIVQRAQEGTAHLQDADLRALSYGRWVGCLQAGIAAHHAGMVPAFKELVEDLFCDGLIKLVFATETLALGINMPARTVVLDSLTKYTGQGHEPLTPGEFTQLTGRAGRRGIDILGHGVVLHSPYMSFEQMTKIASQGSHPLRSSFRPTYNMVVNLVANHDRPQAERLLRASFAQFQQDRTSRGRGKGGLVKLFHQARDLLSEREYVHGWRLTGWGSALRVIYSELDLLLLEAVRSGIFKGLSGPELVALVSCFVYEPRRGDIPPQFLPTPGLEHRWEQLLDLWEDVVTAEQSRGLQSARPPDPGFTYMAFAWAQQAELNDLLDEDQLAPGDFVRNMRQVIDVLRQLRDAGPVLATAGPPDGQVWDDEEMLPAVKKAIQIVDRGVVSARGVI